MLVPIVPWFEIALGGLLVSQVWRRAAAVVAALTLVVFTAAILRRLAQGRRPACACFGAWSAKPIGPVDVVRNLVFVVVALLAAL